MGSWPWSGNPGCEDEFAGERVDTARPEMASTQSLRGELSVHEAIRAYDSRGRNTSWTSDRFRMGTAHSCRLVLRSVGGRVGARAR